MDKAPREDEMGKRQNYKILESTCGQNTIIVLFNFVIVYFWKFQETYRTKICNSKATGR